MEKIDIRTKKGQKELLNALLLQYSLGFDESEKDIQEYQKGYINALLDILSVNKLSFSLEGKLFTNHE